MLLALAWGVIGLICLVVLVLVVKKCLDDSEFAFGVVYWSVAGALVWAVVYLIGYYGMGLR